MTFEVKGTSSKTALGSPESRWDSVKTNRLNNQIIANNQEIVHFNYMLNLIGLKKTISARDFHIYIDIFFNPYNYQICIKSSEEYNYVYKYGERIPEKEIVKMISNPIKDLMEQLKSSKYFR